MNLEPIIGLEIHVQLKTQTKMYCGCRNTVDEVAPNTTICSICTGQPGALPAVNAQALAFGLKTALALGLAINRQVRFDRKNYFYPDLPKGYQITQFFWPVGLKGHFSFPVGDEIRSVAIERLHLEEDAAKSIHRGNATLIDFNRAGAPLMEIVTGPDFHTVTAAYAFLEELKVTLRALGVSDADMEKGQLRVDANISLRPAGESKLYSKTEIKNINSFRNVVRALQHEIERQTKLWEAGVPPTDTTTRGFDEGSGTTVERRGKEAAHDYRYFPEPDIPPLQYSDEYLARVRAELPELPLAKRQRFHEQYAFSPADADQLVRDKALANFAEETMSEIRAWLETSDKANAKVVWEQRKADYAKLVANWLIHRLLPLTTPGFPGKVTPEHFGHLLRLLDMGEVNATSAQDVLVAMANTGADPEVVVREQGLKVVRNTDDLTKVVANVIAQNPDIVSRYKAGKPALLQFLIGKVMEDTRGTADVQLVKEILKQQLD